MSRIAVSIKAESRYCVSGMTVQNRPEYSALALDGITSLSIKPIRIITGIGAAISLIAFALIIYVLVSFFTGNVVSGWSSSLIATSFIGGIQLVSLGVIGEYVGKIYMETKRRPRFIIEERTYTEEEND